jgi:hypothetical protein
MRCAAMAGDGARWWTRGSNAMRAFQHLQPSQARTAVDFESTRQDGQAAKVAFFSLMRSFTNDTIGLIILV